MWVFRDISELGPGPRGMVPEDVGQEEAAYRLEKLDGEVTGSGLPPFVCVAIGRLRVVFLWLLKRRGWIVAEGSSASLKRG